MEIQIIKGRFYDHPTSKDRVKCMQRSA